MYKEGRDNNMQVRTKAQRIFNAKKTVVPISFHVGDYVMILPRVLVALNLVMDG